MPYEYNYEVYIMMYAALPRLKKTRTKRRVKCSMSHETSSCIHSEELYDAVDAVVLAQRLAQPRDLQRERC